MTMAVLDGPVLNAYFRPGGACLAARWRGADQASGGAGGAALRARVILRWARAENSGVLAESRRLGVYQAGKCDALPVLL